MTMHDLKSFNNSQLKNQSRTFIDYIVRNGRWGDLLLIKYTWYMTLLIKTNVSKHVVIKNVTLHQGLRFYIFYKYSTTEKIVRDLDFSSFYIPMTLLEYE